MRRQGLKALIQDFERESGPITAAERRKARALLEAADRPRKRRTTAA
jgi:hypothetical protein